MSLSTEEVKAIAKYLAGVEEHSFQLKRAIDPYATPGDAFIFDILQTIRFECEKLTKIVGG